MTRPTRWLLIGACLLAFAAGRAPAFDTSAQAAFVLDQTTGTVLLAKQADTPLPPASMSKLMTLYVTFEAIRDGRLQMDDTLPVSQHAMSFGGSTMFLDTTDRVSVEDLLRGIVVLSGNDACVVLAEALSPDGTEAGFARLMTERGQRMGLTSSVFKNASGWPAEGHVMSVRDLTLLARRIIEDFPEFYEMFAETRFTFDGRAPSNVNNRNPLLDLGIGADGLKTGHTQEAGYGLVGSAEQDDRRVIFSITGLDTAGSRAREAEAIINWAFRQFAERRIVTADTRLAEAEIFLGAQDRVGLVAREDLTMLVPIGIPDAVQAEVAYTGPIEAPVTESQRLAELIIRPEGLEERRVPLFAESGVAAGGFLDRMAVVSRVLMRRLQDRSGGAM